MDEHCRRAHAAYSAALLEFTAASAAVIARIKAGEHLPKAELDREWAARIHLIEARDSAARFDRLRKRFAGSTTATQAD
jgi:hypothetical protein